MFRKIVLLIVALMILLGGVAIADIVPTSVENNTTNSESLILAINGEILDKYFVYTREGTTITAKINDNDILDKGYLSIRENTNMIIKIKIRDDTLLSHSFKAAPVEDSAML